MKVLHSAALLTPPSGIIRQMESEQLAADRLGLHWDVRMYCPAGVPGADSVVCVQSNTISASGQQRSGLAKLACWIRHRRDYARWVKQVANLYDVVLLRYYVHDPFQLLLVRSIKKPVLFVHHTKEVPELGTGVGKYAWVRATLEAALGPYSIRAATGSIAVTKEILEYERKRAKANAGQKLVYPNGILARGDVIADERRADPEFLFVASEFQPWHGLDLLLRALEKSSAQLVLHLVGKLTDADRKLACKDSRVVLHGHMTTEQIRKLASRCDVGLSSFALDRQGMEEACTLKVREYLDMGLPVYSGHRDVFPAEYPFYRKGETRVSDLLKFSADCAGTDRDAVSKSANPYIEKQVLLSRLYESLSFIFEGSKESSLQR